MKIGLFFGSFNPIHVGHLIIAEYVCQNTDIDELWFVISPQNPFKNKSALLNAYDRLHLVKLAIEGNNKMHASDVEFKLPVPSFSIDTIIYLEEKYPQHTYSIVLGSDGFQNLPKWKNADVLINNYTFIIYLRPDYPVSNTWNAKCIVVKAPLLEISATDIRLQIKEKKSVRYMLPDKVYAEIIQNRYYK